ncbi:MAG: hypothetical protein ACO3BE_06135 [Gemmobacter sp.]
MSTWTNRAGRAAPLLCGVLAGCMGGAYPARVEIGAPAGAPFVVAAPAGFCVDPASSRIGQQSGTVLLAECAVLEGRKREGSVLLAATVAPVPADGEPPSAPALSLGAIGGAAGRAALARNGRAAGVEIIEARAEGAALFVHLSDDAPFAGGAVAPEYRRAFVVLGGRVVALSALAPPGADVAALEPALRAFLAALGAANRG